MSCARVPTSISSNHDDRRLAHSKQVLWRVFHTNANREASGQVHPVQGPLYIREDLSQTAHHVRIRSHSEANTVHHACETDIWLGHHIDLGAHSRSDVLQLAFTKVGDRPPRARIDQCENLLADVRVGAFGNVRIGDASRKRRIDPAVVEIVAGCLYS